MAGSDMIRTGAVALADPHAPVRYSCIAGAAIAKGQCCYVDANGLAQLTDKTICTITTTSKFEGICLTDVSIGMPCTLFGLGAKINMGTTPQVIGSFWWISDTPGELSDTKQAATDTYKPVGKFLNCYVMEIVRRGV